MTADERENEKSDWEQVQQAREARIATFISEELTHGLADPDWFRGRHEARWDRILELDAMRLQIWKDGVASGRCRRMKCEPYELPDYVDAVAEMSFLKDVERTMAIALDFPVWQETQCFWWVNDEDAEHPLWQGGTLRFDLEAGTVTGRVWCESRGQFSWFGDKAVRTVTVEQIWRGQRLNRQLEDARQKGRHEERRAQVEREAREKHEKKYGPQMDLFGGA